MRAILAAVGLLVLAAGPAGAVAEPTATVGIENFTFEPEAITVPAGSTVTWVNHDDIPHVVVSDDKLFKSQPMDTDDAYTKTFDQPGTYAYFCGLHPHMTGTVVVTPTAP